MRSILQIHESYLNGTDNPVAHFQRALEKATTPRAEHAFIRLTEKLGLTQAKNSATRFKNNSHLGLLDGMIVAWKDLFDQQGELTTAASLTTRTNPKAAQSCETYNQLEKSGTCSLGKTNLSEFALGGLGINFHFGTPISTLSQEEKFLPGGSSAGSAVAVGLGIVQIGMGTDTAGSVRVPSAFNGIFGFRPTINRYSRKGVFPLSSTLDSVGVMTNFVEDLVAADKVLASEKNIPPSVRTTQTTKVILDLSDCLGINWDSEVYNAYIKSLVKFEKLGYQVKKSNLKAVATIKELSKKYGTISSIEGKSLHKEVLETDAKSLDPLVYNRLSAAIDIASDEYQYYLKQRNILVQEANLEIGNSLVAHPTVPKLRYNLDKYLNDFDASLGLNVKSLSATIIGSTLDFPGVAMPIKDENKRVESSILISSAQNTDSCLLRHAVELASVL